MSLRARLQGMLAGAVASGACMAVVSRDLTAAADQLQRNFEHSGLGLPMPKVVTAPLPLKVADTPDWSAETKVDAIRSWNEKVRTLHRSVSRKLF